MFEFKTIRLQKNYINDLKNRFVDELCVHCPKYIGFLKKPRFLQDDT